MDPFRWHFGVLLVLHEFFGWSVQCTTFHDPHTESRILLDFLTIFCFFGVGKIVEIFLSVLNIVSMLCFLSTLPIFSVVPFTYGRMVLPIGFSSNQNYSMRSQTRKTNI